MPEHPELIRALHDPACYPHAVRSIRVCETHISWVVLTGEYAYKIKKPVRLPFVDFSTLERRRHFCAEELRLNQRFAPELYVDVVPIAGSLDAPHVGGEGEPIEYAVRLRQFDPAQELSALVEHGRIEADALWQFGARMAAVHAASPAYRQSSSAWRTVQRNLRELGEVPAELPAWLAAEHAKLQPLLERRGSAGRIRECHGDLHAGNVVRWQQVLLAFDCIEFDPQLRQIDVADDVAFLMMDLSARGRSDLAYAFVNGWLESSGDYEAAPLLRWFRVHRALVRTKVERLGGRGENAARYLRTALADMQPATPRLTVMCGLSGSGKTWASTQLLQAIGGLRVRSDVERKRMAGLQAHESSRSLPGQGIYTRELNTRVYEQLAACARTILDAGENAIVDAAFLRRHERRDFLALARELHVAVRIVHCHAPEQALRARLQSRQGDASEATVAVLAQQLEYWEDFEAAERDAVIELDTRDPGSLDDAIAALRG